MSAQDEGQLPFSKLPLAELKNWMEDWMDLPSVNLLTGQGGDPGGGGGTAIDTNDSQVAWQSLAKHPYTSKWCIKLTEVGINGFFTVGTFYCHRFVAPANITTDNLKLMASQIQGGCGAGGDQTWNFGLYNEDLTEKLVESGDTLIEVEQSGPNRIYSWSNVALDAAQALEQDTIYVLVGLPISAGLGGCSLGWVYSGGLTETTVARAQYFSAIGEPSDFELIPLRYGQQFSITENTGAAQPTTLPANLYDLVDSPSGDWIIGDAAFPWFMLD